jgi:hypothetical protein
MNDDIEAILLCSLSSLKIHTEFASGRVRSVSHHASGGYHDNYLCLCDSGRLMARINRGSQIGLSEFEQLNHEFMILKDLETSGIVPRPVLLMQESGQFVRPILLEEYIDNEPFHQIKDDAEIAAILAKLHDTGRTHHPRNNYVNAQKTLFDEAVRLLESDETSGASNLLLEASHLRDKLGARSFTPHTATAIVNTDLNAKNILRSREGYRVVDWEKGRVSTVAWDIAHYLSPAVRCWTRPCSAFSDRRSVVTFCEHYCLMYQSESLNVASIVDEVFSLFPYIAFRCAAWCIGAANMSNCQNSLTEREFAVEVITYSERLSELLSRDMEIQHGYL